MSTSTTRTAAGRPVADANRRQALAIAAGTGVPVLVVLAVIVGLVAGWPIGAAAGVVAAAGASFAVWRAGTRLLLSRLGAHVAPAADEARLHNLVEGLCATVGITKPAVYVIDDAAANAVALGNDSRAAALVVTRGLLDSLTRIELEGVIAHELAHVERNDIAVATMVAAVGTLLPWTGAGNKLLERFVGESREMEADRVATRLTRYPPGLLKALEKIAPVSDVGASGGRRQVSAAVRSLARSWIAPVPASRHARVDTFSERIELLAEL